MFYIFSLLYHIFLLISYRIKIYIQYHYVYYIYTLCLYLIYLHLIYSHLIYSHLIYSHLIYSYLIYSHLIYSHLIYSHLIYSHLIYLPFDIFTIQIHFYNIPKNPQMCPAHRDLPTPTHPHSRLNFPHPIPSHTYNGLKTISLPTTPQAVLLHRLNLPYPIPQHTDTSQQNSHPPQPSTQKKARGVCRGAAALRPLCGFPIFAKKYCVRSPTRTKHSIFQKYFFTFCYLTTRTLYMPSISLSSSNALADAALSRSIRV